MNSSQVKMGQLNPTWKEGMAKSITFCVTEDCNLACKYCYMTGKNKENRMTFDVAKKAVDYILANRDIFKEEAVVWDFIGGEPFLEIDLIDKICDYIKQQTYILNHPWFENYRFNFSTNGILYDTPKVQEYIRKNSASVSIGISVDGNKYKHDLQRVKKDGTGSYDDVVKNVPLWLKQFPGASTKATFSHDDLPHLKDSIISLWELGISVVAANVVFEDVWHEGDDVIFEEQLKALGDYILENHLWDKYSVRFFSPHIGFPLDEEKRKMNYCGAGKMLAIDTQGRLYPCVRFLDISLSNRKGYVIGDIYNGINSDKIRPFLGLSLESQSPKQCLDCSVASGCAWCQGCNYDMADTDTIYQRVTYNCKMHKANVRANEYFWNKFSEMTGLVSPRDEYIKQRFPDKRTSLAEPRFLQFITSDNIIPHCTYKNIRNTSEVMSEEIFYNSLKFAEDNGFTPVMLGMAEYADPDGKKYFSIIDARSGYRQENILAVYDNHADTYINNTHSDNCILLVSKENINKIYNLIVNLSGQHTRINIILQDIDKWNAENTAAYEEQLDKLLLFIVDAHKNNIPFEINVLTDILDTRHMSNCDAGTNTFALAPNGKIFICPAFYFEDPNSFIGDLEHGIQMKNPQILELENAPICSACDAYHCRRCKYLNKTLTGEYNTPSKIQCVISHIERNKSKKLQELLTEEKLISFENIIKTIEYLDPLEKITNKHQRSVKNA